MRRKNIDADFKIFYLDIFSKKKEIRGRGRVQNYKIDLYKVLYECNKCLEWIKYLSANMLRSIINHVWNRTVDILE